MASFTAASSTDSLVGTATFAGGYLLPSRSETVVGYSVAGTTGTWSGNQPWTAQATTSAGLVGSAIHTGNYLLPSRSETVAGYSVAGTTGTWSGNQPWTAQGTILAGLAGAATHAGGYLLPSRSETVVGLQPEESVGTGAFIPSAYFRRVTVEVLNPSNERITDALWLVSENGLPTAAKVENGEAEIQLLRQSMDDFTLIVESGEEGVDFVWYEEVTDDRSIQSTDAKAELVFDPERPATGGGTYAGGGASFG